MRLQGAIVSDRKFRDIAGRVVGSHHDFSIRRDIARVFSVSQLIANQLHRTGLSVEGQCGCRCSTVRDLAHRIDKPPVSRQCQIRRIPYLCQTDSTGSLRKPVFTFTCDQNALLLIKKVTVNAPAGAIICVRPHNHRQRLAAASHHHK